MCCFHNQMYLKRPKSITSSCSQTRIYCSAIIDIVCIKMAAVNYFYMITIIIDFGPWFGCFMYIDERYNQWRN